jgi:hypothetical protein
MGNRSQSRLRDLLDRVRRWWNREPDFPGDPFAYRMAPLRRGPKGRSSAAAVAEPDEEIGTSFAIRFFGKTKQSRD